MACLGLSPNKNITNFYKGWLAFYNLRVGLQQYTENVVKEEHIRILNKIGFPSKKVCRNCTIKDLKPLHKKTKENGRDVCLWHQKNCNCCVHKKKPCKEKVCTYIYEEILKTHASEPPSPEWKNTDITKWTEDPWEIAKCFINAKGYANKTSAKDMDCAGLLHVIVNNQNYQEKLKEETVKLLQTMRDRRNTLCHLPSMELESQELNTWISDIFKILEDPELKSGAEKVVQNLKELQNTESYSLSEADNEKCRAEMGIWNEMNQMNAKLNHMDSDIMVLTTNQHSFKEDLWTSKKHIWTNREDVRSLQFDTQTRGSFRSIRSELSNNSECVSNIQSDLQTTREKVQFIESRLTTCNENLQSVRHECRANTKHILSNQSILKKRLESVERDIKAIMTELQSLKEMFISENRNNRRQFENLKSDFWTRREAESIQSTFNVVTKSFERLQVDVQTNTNRWKSLNSECMTMRADVNFLQTGFCTATKDLGFLESDFKTIRENVQVLKSNFSTTKENISSVQTDHGATKEKIQYLETDFGTTKRNVHSLQTDFEATKGSFQSLRTDVKTIKKTLRATQTDHVTTNEKIQSFQTDFGTTKKTLQAIQTESETIRGSLQSLYADVKTIKETLRATQTDHVTTNEKIQSFQTDFGTTKKTLQVIQTESETIRERLQSLYTDLKNIKENLRATQSDRLTRTESVRSLSTDFGTTSGSLHTQTDLRTSKDNLQSIQTDFGTIIEESPSIQIECQTNRDEVAKTMNQIIMQPSKIESTIPQRNIVQGVIRQETQRRQESLYRLIPTSHRSEITKGTLSTCEEISNFIERTFKNINPSINHLEKCKLPSYFEKFPLCKRYGQLMVALGRFAFELLIQDKVSMQENEFQISFGSDLFMVQAIDDIFSTVLLNTILLKKETTGNTQLTFVDTSYLEYFAAVYIASQTDYVALAKLFEVYDTFAKEMKLAKSLNMICALSFNAILNIFEHIYRTASEDNEYEKCRKDYLQSTNEYFEFRKSMPKPFIKLQNLFDQSIAEYKLTNPSSELKVPLLDVVIFRECEHTIKCLEKYVEPVKVLHVYAFSYTKYLKTILTFANLQTIVIDYHYKLSHDDLCELAQFVSRTRTLQNISVRQVSCKCNNPCKNLIDLSSHSHLETLHNIQCEKAPALQVLYFENVNTSHLEFYATFTDYSLFSIKDSPNLKILKLNSLTYTSRVHKVITSFHKLEELVLVNMTIENDAFQIEPQISCLKNIKMFGVQISLSSWQKFVDSLLGLTQSVTIERTNSHNSSSEEKFHMEKEYVNEDQFEIMEESFCNIMFKKR